MGLPNMSPVKCVLMALAMALIPRANANAAGAWSEVLRLDCNGNLNFMNNHLLAAQGDVKDVIDMAQFISGRANILSP